jgi:hypothetical protein
MKTDSCARRWTTNSNARTSLGFEQIECDDGGLNSEFTRHTVQLVIAGIPEVSTSYFNSPALRDEYIRIQYICLIMRMRDSAYHSIEYFV